MIKHRVLHTLQHKDDTSPVILELRLLQMQIRIKENRHTGWLFSLEDRSHFVMQRSNVQR